MNKNNANDGGANASGGRRKRVLILGGGFGGLYAARRLGQTLGRRADVEVALIARENYLLFTPMLHEVAAGDLNPADIVAPVRKMVRNARLIQGEVTGIDVQAHVVCYRVGALRQPREITYDHLLIALGSETHYFGMSDVEAVAATMKSLADAALLHTRMVAALEEAAQDTDAERRRHLLTFVVAGGGFAGVETVGAVNDFLRDAIRHYPELHSSMLRVVLVHSGELVLPELNERLSRYTMQKLSGRGVELRLGARVSGYRAGMVLVTPGEPIGSMSLIWTAGATPAPVLSSLNVEKVKGRLKVNEFLEVAGQEGVGWAVGDCAAVPDGDGFHPPTAQHGMREGVAAARNIEAAVTGGQRVPFRFSTIGQLASIGHRVGVAQVLGMRFSGLAAWWLWRTVYLAKLPGFSKKLRVAIKWSLELLFPREIEQLVTFRDLDRVEKLGALLRATRSEAEVQASQGLRWQEDSSRRGSVSRPSGVENHVGH
ncbi:MAG: NAD(P)/FAD-dependent oxidoreductase [Phycisphaerales bacterium]|nr:NAD(P)/FAD-dependent oxidoreductase [Phycisphaerales bacterium]